MADDSDMVMKDAAALKLITFCVLVLRNGFTVTGEAYCADPAKFNAETGRIEARQNAVQKIWPLMVYELRTKLAGLYALIPPVRFHLSTHNRHIPVSSPPL